MVESCSKWCMIWKPCNKQNAWECWMCTGCNQQRSLWGPNVPTLKGTEASFSYVQCFLYLVSSSINVSIFHSTWLDSYIYTYVLIYIHTHLYMILFLWKSLTNTNLVSINGLIWFQNFFSRYQCYNVMYLFEYFILCTNVGKNYVNYNW